MIKKVEAKLIRLFESLSYFVVWWGFCTMCRGIPFFLYKLEIEGAENIPKKGRFIMVANHMNFFDGYLMVIPVGPLRQITFLIAKRALNPKAIRPFWLLMARLIGTVVLDDSNQDAYARAFKKLHRVLSHNRPVIIFPEGSISKNKIPRKFKGGVAKLSMDSKTKVIPAYIEGTYGFRHMSYWFKRPVVKIKYGKPIELYRHAKECDNDLDKMAALLRDKVIELGGLEDDQKTVQGQSNLVPNCPPIKTTAI